MTCGYGQEIGDRSEQQDARGFSDPTNMDFVRHGGVAGAVADGVGSLKSGKMASETAVQTFLRYYQMKTPGESIPSCLQRSLLGANQAVIDVSRRAGVQGESASTFVAAVVHGEHLYWISAGDSRAYLIRNGRMYRLTVDHNVGTELDDQVAAHALDPREAAASPDRERVTSFLGLDIPMLDRNLSPFPLTSGDKVMLCSDGVYKAVSEETIAACCSAATAQECCNRIVDSVRGQKIRGQDNYTVIVMDTGSGGRRVRGFQENAVLAMQVALVLLAAAIGWLRTTSVLRS